MNADAPSPSQVAPSVVRRGLRALWKVGKVGLLFLLLAIFLLFVGDSALVEVAFHIAFGWLVFLWRNFPQLHWNPELLASGAIALIMAAGALHLFASWILSCRKSESFWKKRATLASVMAIVVLFAAAISGIGAGHQVGWLSDVRWFGYSESRPVLRQESDAVGIYSGLKIWQEDEDAYPDHLEEMEADLAVKGFFGSTDASPYGSTPEPWIYLAAGLPTNAPDWLPLLAAPRSVKSDGTRLVLLKNGDRQWLNAGQYQDLMDRRRDYLASAKLP
jgi:hypothetical protein